MRRLQQRVHKKLAKAIGKDVGITQAMVDAAQAKLEERAAELDVDTVRAACAVHPYNKYRVRAEGVGGGICSDLACACREGSYRVARAHPACPQVQNQAMTK